MSVMLHGDGPQFHSVGGAGWGLITSGLTPTQAITGANAIKRRDPRESIPPDGVGNTSSVCDTMNS